MAGAEDDWWIIGSVAVLLHGSDPGGIADVDVLLSEADAERLLEPRGIQPEMSTPHPLFHSRWFARWDGTPVPVEYMAGFSLAEAGQWVEVRPQSRVEIAFGAAKLFVTDRNELRALLTRFGRGKDLQRAAAL